MTRQNSLIKKTLEEYLTRFDDTYDKVPILMYESSDQIVFQDLSETVTCSESLYSLVDNLTVKDNKGAIAYCFCYPGSLVDDDFEGNVVTIEYCEFDAREGITLLQKIVPKGNNWELLDSPWVKSSARNRFVKTFQDIDLIRQLDIHNSVVLTLGTDGQLAKAVELNVNHYPVFKLSGFNHFIPDGLKRVGLFEFEGRLIASDTGESYFYTVKIEKLGLGLEERQKVEIFFSMDDIQFMGIKSLVLCESEGSLIVHQ